MKKSTYFIAILSLLFIPFTILAQALPEDFPTITTTINGETDEGNIFLSVSTETDGVGYYVFTMNNNGDILNYRKLENDFSYDFKMQENGLFSYAQFISHHSYTGGGNCIHTILDQDMNLVKTYSMKNGYIPEAHDFQILPNGHILMFGYYFSQMDLSEIVDGGFPDAKVSGGIIQELDTEGKLVFQWRSWDYYDPETYAWGKRSNKQTVSAFHLNAISLDNDGNIFLSTPSWVRKISRQTGEVLYTISGTENEFSFIGSDSLESIDHFGGHAFHRIKNGNVLIYDNGGLRTPDPTSEIYEYKLDEENKTAELIWSYIPENNIPAWHRGNAQRLDNGNTMIGWGGASGETIPVCTEVDPEGKTVFEASFNKTEVESYRAFRFKTGNGLISENTEIEIAEGNQYSFIQGDTLDTGIEVEVSNITGDGYNELKVSSYSQAPINPDFPGKDPLILAKRICLCPTGITLSGKLFFDVAILEINNPNDITIYFRDFEGKGLFTPLETTYNFVTGKIIADFNISNIDCAEFIFAYPDIESLALAVMPISPKPYEKVNQELPVRLEWAPSGLFTDFKLQIANDENFENIVLEQEYIDSCTYLFNAENNTQYFWRVKTYTESAQGFISSDWSETTTFFSSSPYVKILNPAEGEKWQYGLDYFIKWEDNLSENLILDLYDNNIFLENIDAVESDGNYKWSIPVNTAPGCKYSIKISSTEDESLISETTSFFSIVDTAGNDGCNTYVKRSDISENIKIYPNPVMEDLHINYQLDDISSVNIQIINILGEKTLQLLKETQYPGIHTERFSIKNLDKNIYFLKIKINNKNFYRKIIVLPEK